MSMHLSQARALLASIDQTQVLRFADRLDACECKELLHQIAQLDAEGLRRMRAMVTPRDGLAPVPTALGEIEPAPVLTPDPEERRHAAAAGEAALREGRVGVILVAGGQGSRLGFEGPKGCFPIGPVSNATLFEIHARKVLARQRRYGAPVPLYIMTSDSNDAETRAFFARQAFFGLQPDNVRFFVQGMWPALDAEGHILLEHPGRLFMSPDGHGGTLAALERNGMLADMARRGVETLFYFQVDNPMVDIADPVFIGLHLREDAEMSLKVCAKRDADEGLGVVVLREGRPAMVEYTELTPTQRHARDPRDGGLRLRYGSVAIHVFDRAFLERAASRPLPLHLAHKRVPCVDATGQRVEPSTPNAWKFETFIFDVMPDARRVLNVAFDRAEEFSPVKNREGVDSPATCKRDLNAKFARWLEAAGARLPRDPQGELPHPVEIDPVFADSVEALKARLQADWKPEGPIWLHES